MSDKSFISVRDLSFTYEAPERHDLYVLKNLSLDIEKGSLVAVLGHNGSGKSTLAKLLNMILTPTSGKIYIDGIEITSEDMTEDDIFNVRSKVGMVFQNPDNQLVATIVEEDIAFGPENMGIEPSEIRRRVDEALATVGMTEYAKHSPHQLSGGQKQRIAIAGIIAMLPQCIIFDESTAMLDPSGRKEVMDTIKKLNKEKGITILYITHNMDEAIQADRVVVINEGELYLDGTPKEVFSKVDKLRIAGLDVPQVTELFYDLQKDGFNLPSDILYTDEAVEAMKKELC